VAGSGNANQTGIKMTPKTGSGQTVCKREQQKTTEMMCLDANCIALHCKQLNFIFSNIFPQNTTFALQE